MRGSATPGEGETRPVAFRKRWEVLDRLVGIELILVSDAAAGTVVHLVRQPAGRLLWQLLAQARTASGLVQVLAQARGRAPVDRDSSDVHDFLAALEEAQLIVEVKPPPEASAVDPPSQLTIPPGDDLPPTLEVVDLKAALPKDLVLQGASHGGFHAAAHNMRGAGC
jgi:hypothetical protein